MSWWRKVRTSGTGLAGHRSGRWMPRAEAKAAAKRKRRREDKIASRLDG